MTSNEILQADLLDIIFDKRNKDYGAYTLRRNYPQRMLLALSGTAAVLLTFILLNLSKKETIAGVSSTNNDRGHKLIIVELPPIEQPAQPHQPARQQPVERVSTIRHTSQITIRPNELARTTVPSFNELNNNQVGNETTTGTPQTGVVQPSVTGNNTGDVTDQQQNASRFVPVEKQPEFPGGMEAMMRFLKLNLRTPYELQAGDRKTVHIRFRIETDGTVTAFEIIQSAGRVYDQEVIRVCKKMPRWSPAYQNGVNVPMQFILPVTFIGVEEE